MSIVIVIIVLCFFLQVSHFECFGTGASSRVRGLLFSFLLPGNGTFICGYAQRTTVELYKECHENVARSRARYVALY